MDERDPGVGRHRTAGLLRPPAARRAGPEVLPGDTWLSTGAEWSPTVPIDGPRGGWLTLIAAAAATAVLSLAVLTLTRPGSLALTPSVRQPPAALQPADPDPTPIERQPAQSAPPRTSTATPDQAEAAAGLAPADPAAGADPIGPRPRAASATASLPATTPAAPTTAVPPTTVTVTATRTWNRGDVVQTNRTRLLLQNNGDLVIIDENGTTRWRAGTTGAGHHTVFQDDGQLVVYDSGQRPLWTSNTGGNPGAVLVLKADGNVTIGLNGTVFWSSNTAH